VPSQTLRERRSKLDAAVLDAGERQSLVAVRSLGRSGLRVGSFDWHSFAPAFSSRWCAVHGAVPDCAVDPSGFVDALLALAEQHEVEVVIPARDGTIDALRARRADLDGRLGLALAHEQALAIAVDKARTLDLARTLGIPVPVSVPVDDLDLVGDALREVRLPAVVKPRQSWVHGNGSGRRLQSCVVVSRAEAGAAVERVLDTGGSVVLQQLLWGSREAVSLLYAEGRVWARFAQVAHRMLPPLGGSSIVRESIPLPADLTEAAEKLVVAAGLEGYSEVEFRRDADGTGMLMEVNPRLSASVEIAVRAGVDFPVLVYNWAAGLPLTDVTRYRLGMRMRWLGGDVRWLRTTLASQGRPEAVPARRAIATFVGDFFRGSAYDYLDARDLRPAMAAAAHSVGRVLARRRTPDPTDEQRNAPRPAAAARQDESSSS
jgi:predicted ATP-grasp superfamily ATP-dependent carboligase